VARVCEVCGHAFAAASLAEVAVSQLPDLDVPSAADAAVVVVPLPELEATRFAPATFAPDWSEDDWERNSIGVAGDVAAGGLPEMDTGREETPPEPAAPNLTSVTCRYCRHVQTAGLMCDGCGMRLPWTLRAVPPLGEGVDRDVLVRCQRCGERTYQRERCSSCGGVLSVPE